MTTRFTPAWWLPGGHAQTIGGRLLRHAGDVSFRAERVETPDGDELVLEYTSVGGRPPDPAAPLVLTLHGLEGSAHSNYTAELARALAAHGVRSVGLNFRSCGGIPNRTARFYHSGETGDLALVIEHLRRRHGGPLAAVGFSLGGNVLLKYLGERQTTDAAGVAGAAAISVPYDLAESAARIDGGAGRIYARFFLRSLRQKVLAKRAMLEELVDMERVLAARTVQEFDDALTAPLHGFTDAADYYARSSAGPYLPAIRVPTLLIHAGDDPMAPGDLVPREAIAANPCLTLLMPEEGGHVGFVEGTPGHRHLWAEDAAAEFVAGELQRIASSD